MKNICTINDKDLVTGNDYALIVRSQADRIAVCMSEQDSGDTEVFMSRNSVLRLIEGLQEALDALDETHT